MCSTKGRSKRLAVATILAAVLAACSAGLIAERPSARAESYALASFAMEEGASVRLDDKKALRFTTKVLKSELEAVIAAEGEENVRVVTMIAYASAAEQAETFEKGTVFTADVVFSEGNGNLYGVEAGENYEYRACLYDLEDKNVAKAFAARSYIEANGEVLAYTAFDAEKNARSAYEVAKAAIADDAYVVEGDEELTKKQLANLEYLSADFTLTVKADGYETQEIAVKRGESLAEHLTEYYEAIGANGTCEKIDEAFDEQVNAPVSENKTLEVEIVSRHEVENGTCVLCGEKRNALAAEEIESFDHKFSAENVKMTMGETSSLRYWAEEVDGVTGSIRFDMADQWPQILVRPRQELKTAEGYNWISFKLYLDPTGLDDAHRHKLITNTLNGRTNDVMLTAGRWTEVYLDAATFLSSVDEEGFGILGGFLNDNATDRLGEFRAYSPFTCYLADVRMVKANAPEEDQLLDFSQSGALLHVHSRGAKNWDYGFNLSVTEEAIGGREGAKLAMEAVNPACGYPALFVDPAYDLAYYTEKGYTHIKASLYIDGATLTTGTSKTAIFFLNGQHQFQENIPADEWVEVQIPIENFFDNVNGEGFAALFNFVNERAAQDAAMTVYLGGIEAVKPAGNVIYSPSAVNVYTQKATYAVYDGDVGGVKNPIEFTVGTGGQADIQIFVTPLLDKEYCVQQGFTHVKMRVYIDSETLTEASRATGGKAMLILPNSAGENCELVQIPLDCWYEMVFTVADFYAARMQDGWLPLFTFYNFDYSENGAQLYFADEGFKIYLDTVSAFTPEQ